MFLTDLFKYSVLATFCYIPPTKITTFMSSINFYSYDNLEYYSPFGPKYLPSNLKKLLDPEKSIGDRHFRSYL